MATAPMSDASNKLTIPWMGFGFKLITKADYPKVLASLQATTYLDEPMRKLTGMTTELSADLDQKHLDILDLNHGSFYAYPLDNPDKIASVLLLWCHEKGKSLPFFEVRSPVTQIMRKSIAKLHTRYDIHQQKGVDIYPEIYLISTDGEFRGKGLGTEMYRKAIDKCRSEGHEFIASTFSNPLSRKIGEKLGFKAVSRIEFDEFKKPDGSLLFGEAGHGQFVDVTILDF